VGTKLFSLVLCRKNDAIGRTGVILRAQIEFMSLLSIENVRKQYEGHLAVDRVDLEIPEGIIFGLLGPNGAGKTTLIRMITGITRPDQGTISLRGEPITGVLNTNIGYLPEERGLYKKMKVAEQLVYLAQLKGLERKAALDVVRFWLERFGMMDWRRRTIEELSKGMQQKIQFIATIQHDPDLIILDEPFTGLDPVNTNLIKDEIHALRSKGKSIIFSTHRMEQVEEICEEIALINAGKNILQGGVAKIKNDFKEGVFEVLTRGPLPAGFDQRFNVIEVNDEGCRFKVGEEEVASDALRWLLDQKADIVHFEEILPSLNEVFIKTVSA
jgi:ABC-2 type transport system ATP-binding protein